MRRPKCWIVAGCFVACAAAGPLAGCSAASTETHEIKTQTSLPVCPPSAPTRADDGDVISAEGAAPTLEQAIEQARAELVRGLETQVQARNEGIAELHDEVVHNEFTTHVSSWASRTLSACETTRRCRQDGLVHATVRCDRRTPLDREVGLASPKLAAALPRDAIILVVPGTDQDGWITALGEHVAQLFLARMDNAALHGAKFAQPSRWEPAKVRDVARENNATHFLRIQHRSLGPDLVEVQASLLDVATDLAVPGSNVLLQAHLLPEQAGLMAVRGPLFPQKGVQDLAGSQHGKAELAVSQAIIAAGSEVRVKFKLQDDSYVLLLDLYEDGRIASLVPGPLAPAHKFARGIWHLGDQKLIACPLPGHVTTRENIKLIAASEAFWAGIVPDTEDGVVLEPGRSGTIAALVVAAEKWRASGKPMAEVTIPYTVDGRRESKNCPAWGQ